MAKKQRIDFYNNYLIISYLFNKVTINYKEIDKIIYTKCSIKNYFLHAKSPACFPGRLNILLKPTNPNSIFSGKLYFVIYKFEDLDKLPKSLQKKLVVNK